jgi:serine/threonine-protein kinase
MQRDAEPDLDLIVAKALRKEPSQRYATVTAFAEDLQRFLRDEPVLARPATFRYRATKFLHRNRTWVVAGTIAALMLVVLTIVALIEAGDARRQRQEAVRQRDEAVVQRDRAFYEERRASASSNLMNSVLESVAPGGEAFTTLQLLDRGRELLESDYGPDPRLAARMMVEFADHYSDLAQAPREEALLEHAEQLATEQGDFETAAHAACRLSESHLIFGPIEPARPSLDRARRALARVPLPRPEVRVACYLAESELASMENQPDTVSKLNHRVLALIDSAADTASIRYARDLGKLAGQFALSPEMREALALQHRRLQVLTRLGLGHTVSMGDALLVLADLHSRVGEYRTADSLLTLARQVGRGIDRAGPAPVVDQLLYSAYFVHQLGFQDSARAEYLRALAMARRLKDAGAEGWAYRGLVELALDEGWLREAERYLAEGERLFNERARAHYRARLVAAQGKPRIAQRMMREALVAAGFPNLPLYAQHVPKTLAVAAEIALEAGDPPEADSLARHAVRIAHERGHLETESGELGSVLVVLAQARLALGDSTGARDALERGIPGLRNGLGVAHRRTLAAEAMLKRLRT